MIDNREYAPFSSLCWECKERLTNRFDLLGDYEVFICSERCHDDFYWMVTRPRDKARILLKRLLNCIFRRKVSE